MSETMRASEVLETFAAAFSTSATLRNVPLPVTATSAALTAFARSEDRTKALERGFETHLAKPVDPGELVASIATLVRRRSRGR
jgi:DNA-binding response OmpR family regulator